MLGERRKKKRSRLCPGQRTNLHAPVAAELATPASASSVTASAAGVDSIGACLPLSVKTQGTDDDEFTVNFSVLL